MSEDTTAVEPAARLAARWRQFQRAALDAASATANPAARRDLLFVAESYRHLTERAELRTALLAAVQEAKRGPGSAIGTRGEGDE